MVCLIERRFVLPAGCSKEVASIHKLGHAHLDYHSRPLRLGIFSLLDPVLGSHWIF